MTSVVQTGSSFVLSPAKEQTYTLGSLQSRARPGHCASCSRTPPIPSLPLRKVTEGQCSTGSSALLMEFPELQLNHCYCWSAQMCWPDKALCNFKTTLLLNRKCHEDFRSYQNAGVGEGIFAEWTLGYFFFFLVCSFDLFLLCQGSQPLQSQRSHWVSQYVPCVAPVLDPPASFSCPHLRGQIRSSG